MNESNLLTIGSVVTLKDNTLKFMIIGYASVDEKTKEKIYDYSACLYPVGVLASDKIIMFNHDKVDKVILDGYKDSDSTKFLDNVKEILKNKEKLLVEISKQENIK